jgi:hypothetical protein
MSASGLHDEDVRTITLGEWSPIGNGTEILPLMVVPTSDGDKITLRARPVPVAESDKPGGAVSVMDQLVLLLRQLGWTMDKTTGSEADWGRVSHEIREVRASSGAAFLIVTITSAEVH